MTGTLAPSGADRFDDVVGLLGPDDEPTLPVVVERTVAAAGRIHPAAFGVSLNLLVHGRPVTVGSSDAVCGRIDALRLAHDTAHAGDDALMVVGDLGTDPRWTAFAAVALESTPLQSMALYRLQLGGTDPFGSLCVYADRPHAFGAAELAVGRRLAAYTGALLAHAQQRDKAANLELALDSNRDIGVAIGIVMTRYLISRNDALARLRAASQRANSKLAQLALAVIETGDLPER